MLYLKDEILKGIITRCPNMIKAQESNGRFNGSDGKYNVYEQYAGYVLAFLYLENNPVNPYYQKEEILQAAVRGWDFYHSETNTAGLVRISTHGHYWGDYCDEWGAYYWMNTINLIKDKINPEKLELWNSRLACIASKMKAEIELFVNAENAREKLAKSTRNHFVWMVLAYYRYGMLYNDSNAMAFAEDVMELIISVQQPSGSWLEGGSPVVHYMDVTICAISIFAHFSNNLRAYNAIEKSLDYVLNMTYPDQTRIACIDGRNRYKTSLQMSHTAPTFTASPRGLAYLSNRVAAAIGYDGGFCPNLHALTATTEIASIIPGEAPFIPQKIEVSTVDYPEIRAHICRDGAWVIPMCCGVQQEFENRFQLYRQNLFSIYHNKAGLIIGGGHSIAQTQFSCFNIISGSKLCYLHEDGKIENNTMHLIYAGKRCGIDINIISESSLSVCYTIEGLKDVERAFVNIPIVGRHGGNILIDGENYPWDKSYKISHIPPDTEIIYKEARITISEDALYNYPLFPYNSYLVNQNRSFDEVFAVLTVELNENKPSCVLRVDI